MPDTRSDHYLGDQSTARTLAERARAVMPGGNTRLTVFQAPHPAYALKGQGAILESTDGDRWIDFVNNMTSLIHGHADPDVTRAAVRATEQGASFSLPTESEVVLAEAIVARVGSVERIRFANSGAEGVTLAIKAAQAFTGRPALAKFEGSYHGTHDLVVPSTATTPDSWTTEEPVAVPNMHQTPRYVLDNTVVLRYNRLDIAKRVLRREADRIAAVIVDPMPARSGLIQGTPEFLAGLRRICTELGIVLIFDEVISYRVAPGGMQSLVGVTPDLTTLGKIIGGGFPVGAVGGRTDIMALFDPTQGPRVSHGGTFNANPVTMAAGAAAVAKLTPARYTDLNQLGALVREGLSAYFRESGVPVRVHGRGSLFCVRFGDGPAAEFRDLAEAPADTGVREYMQTYLRSHGIMTHQNLFGCVSTAMGEAEVGTLLERVRAGLTTLPGRP